MKIGAADRGGCDFDNTIFRIEDLRIVNGLYLHLLCSHPAYGLHDCAFLLLRCGSPTGCPSTRGISPVSISALNLLSVSPTCCPGSSPVSFENQAANFPPGGS